MHKQAEEIEKLKTKTKVRRKKKVIVESTDDESEEEVVVKKSKPKTTPVEKPAPRSGELDRQAPEPDPVVQEQAELRKMASNLTARDYMKMLGF